MPSQLMTTSGGSSRSASSTARMRANCSGSTVSQLGGSTRDDDSRLLVETRPLHIHGVRRGLADVEDLDAVTHLRQAEREKRIGRRGPVRADASEDVAGDYGDFVGASPRSPQQSPQGAPRQAQAALGAQDVQGAGDESGGLGAAAASRRPDRPQAGPGCAARRAARARSARRRAARPQDAAPAFPAGLPVSAVERARRRRLHRPGSARRAAASRRRRQARGRAACRAASAAAAPPCRSRCRGVRRRPARR